MTCTVPPCASVWCTREVEAARRALSSVVPSSGQLPFATCARPHGGHWYAGWSTPSCDEQQLDAAVGGGLERLLPARRGAAVLAGLLAPALEQLLARARAHHASSTGVAASSSCGASACASAVAQPSETALHLVREHLLELGAHLLRADEHDARAARLAHAARRASRRHAASAARRSRRCGARSAPATSRPGRAGPARPSISSAISTSCPPRSRKTWPRSRPTAATSTPSPGRRARASGAR